MAELVRVMQVSSFSDDGGGEARGDQEEIGGYDCEFVEKPPDDIQTNCPICLLILKEPCLISCKCGHKICRQCIERIKDDDKPCPMCNKTVFSYLRDHGAERYLKQREVWCSKKAKGCEWKGKLKDYEEHLNEDPSEEEQLDGCKFIEVECVHGCGESVLRCNLATHQDKECLDRPYSCEYCNDYDSTYGDVVDSHYEECSHFPVSCPNNCQSDSFKRGELKEHKKDKCPLVEVKCPLHYAGCVVKLQRKDVAEHMKDAATHLTLLAAFTQSLFRENQELRRDNQELKNDVENLNKEMHQVRLSLGTFPIDFRIKYPNEKETIYLPSFYSHSHGYRMCVRVDPNGIGDGEGTHVSIFAYLMKGLYDDHLKWPFRGDVTIQIVNQLGDHNHVEEITLFNDIISDIIAARVTDKERANYGRGQPQFLAHKDLEHNPAANTQYLKNGFIIVRLIRVKVN